MFKRAKNPPCFLEEIAESDMSAKKRVGFAIYSGELIAILAAMLLPVLSKAREKARGALCMNNLKQIGTAIGMYIIDYDDYFPPARVEGYGSVGTWIIPIAPYLGYRRPQNIPDDYRFRTWLSQERDNVFYCPSSYDYKGKKFGKGIARGAITYDPTTRNRYGPKPGAAWIDYGDSNGSFYPNGANDAAKYARKYSKMVMESVVLFECWLNTNGLPLTDYYNLSGYTQKQEFRHNDFMNCLFTDFHVEAIHKREPYTFSMDWIPLDRPYK